jgi:hypothetical protein
MAATDSTKARIHEVVVKGETAMVAAWESRAKNPRRSVKLLRKDVVLHGTRLCNDKAV